MGRIKVLFATTVAMLAVAAVPASADPPTVTAFQPNQIPGSPSIDIALAVPRGIDTSARNGNADWQVQATVTYNSVNNDLQILDPGPVPIKDTVVLGQIDSHTDLVKLTLAFGSLPLPGNNPSFVVTAQLLRPGGG